MASAFKIFLVKTPVLTKIVSAWPLLAMTVFLSGCIFDRNNGDGNGSTLSGQNSGTPVPQQSIPNDGQQTTGVYNRGQVVRTASGTNQTITVQPGQTLYSLARLYKVPLSELMAANGIQQPTTLSAGQRLVIPGSYGATAAANNSAAPPVSDQGNNQQNQQINNGVARPATNAKADVNAGLNSGRHTVRAGETLYSVARKYNVPINKLAAANGLTTTAGISAGRKLVIPGASNKNNVVVKPVRDNATAKQKQVAKNNTKAEPAKPKTNNTGVNNSNTNQDNKQPAQNSDKSGNLSFAAPVRARIISRFGAVKDSGGFNEGVNFSVPKGTGVKAVADGKVVYVGQALKAYGKMILIQHDDNWVSAYAHNSETLVKKGDSVTRGQKIALAGNTGAVSSPQLHFELRRNAKPVDPTKYISGIK